MLSSTVVSAGIQEEEGSDLNNGYLTRVLCVDGVKVLQTIAFSHGSDPAVSNIQLMEEKDGKLLPMQCALEVQQPEQ